MSIQVFTYGRYSMDSRCWLLTKGYQFMKNEYYSCLHAMWKSRIILKREIKKYKCSRFIKKLYATVISIFTCLLMFYIENQGNYLADVLFAAMSDLPYPFSTEQCYNVVNKTIFVTLPSYVSLKVRKYAYNFIAKHKQKCKK